MVLSSFIPPTAAPQHEITEFDFFVAAALVAQAFKLMPLQRAASEKSSDEAP